MSATGGNLGGTSSGTGVIAIDGPAVSGKTTVGRKLAARIGFKFLDTGPMYRAATLFAIRNGIDVRDTDAVTMIVSRMQWTIASDQDGGTLILINGEDVTPHLHSPEVDESVSAVSAVTGVRNIMVSEQRELAAEGGIVMVGRDIGTVVIPDAPLKIYLTASVSSRAHRRYREFVSNGVDVRFDDILRSMEERDRVDSSRDNSPLRPACDAKVVETDDLSVDEVVEKLVELAGEMG